jgi:hypothetical protein
MFYGLSVTVTLSLIIPQPAPLIDELRVRLKPTRGLTNADRRGRMKV